MSSFQSLAAKPLLDLPPEELLDIAVEKLQRASIRLVEWRTLLYRRMNVPRIVTVSLPRLFRFFFHYC
jgi:hypothetical protein